MPGTLSKPANWKTFFLTHPTNPEFDDNIPTLFSTFDQNQSTGDCFKSAAATPQIPFLALDPVHLDVLLMHNFIASEGNLLHRNTSHFAHITIVRNMAYSTSGL